MGTAAALQLYRNVRGRYDLMALLCKWDHNYRKELAVTAIAFCIFFYSLATWNTPYDLVALSFEAALIFLQLGGTELSLMPADYRPSHDGTRYTAQGSAHVSCGEVSFLLSHIRPSKAEEEIGFRNPLLSWGRAKDNPLVSDRVDDFLMTRENLPWEEVKTETNFIRSRHQLRYLAIRVTDPKQHTTNGVKLEIQSPATVLAEDRPLVLRKAFYFDKLLTVEAFRSRIFRNNLKGEKEVYTDLTPYFPADQEIIDGVESLRLRPEIYKEATQCPGTTTLLLTESRRVALLRQGSGNVIGANAYHLGGSGSMNYADMAESGDPKDFRTAVKYSMARELCEETGIPRRWMNEARNNTLVTGFFRWIDRCGQPEFVGLSVAGQIPFSRLRAIDGDEVISYDEIPVPVNRVEDFIKVMDYVRENKLNVVLSSLMALHRLTVIAAYNKGGASEEQRRIYQEVSDLLDRAGPNVLEDIYI